MTNALESAGAAANERPDRKLASAVAPCPKGTLELSLAERGGDPVADEPFLVVDAAGASHRGKLDSSGFAKIEGLAPGSCRVSFPELAFDGDAPPEHERDGGLYWPGTERNARTDSKLQLEIAGWDAHDVPPAFAPAAVAHEAEEEEADEWELEELTASDEGE